MRIRRNILLNNNNNIYPRRINNNYINNNQNYRSINFYNNIYINTNRNIIIENQNNQNINREIFYGYFILLYEPNKMFCIIALLLNIIFCGFGTFIIGANKKSKFYMLLGIIQCLCFYFFIIYDVSLENKTIFGRKPVQFFHHYFKLLASLFYISSIYISFFRNFIFCNPRLISNYNINKEKGIFIIFLNILIGGLGTIFSSLIIHIKEQVNKCYNIKLFGYGILQLSGYILSLYGIELIPENKKIIGFLFLYGGLCYCLSIFTAIKIYKRLVQNNPRN